MSGYQNSICVNIIFSALTQAQTDRKWHIECSASLILLTFKVGARQKILKDGKPVGSLVTGDGMRKKEIHARSFTNKDEACH